MTLTLGFIGSGEPPSEILLERLLEDQVSSVKGDVFLVLPEQRSGPIEFVVQWFADEGARLGVPDGLGANYETYGDLVKAISKTPKARLLVFWDNKDHDTIEAVSQALDLGIEVRDLNDVLAQIDRVVTEKKENHMAYTRADLEVMEEAEIIPLAESFGVDHEACPDWDSLNDAILAAQEAQDGGAPVEEDSEATPEGVAETAEGDGAEPYTLEELSTFDLNQLKQVVKDNGIDGYTDDKGAYHQWGEPGTRPRARVYVDTILAWQEEVLSGESAAPAAEHAPTEVEEESDFAVEAELVPYEGPALSEEDLEAVGEVVRAEVQGAVGALTENGFKPILDVLDKVLDSLDALTKANLAAMVEANKNANAPTAAPRPPKPGLPPKPVSPTARTAQSTGARLIRR